MSEFKNDPVVELNVNELDQAAGGVNRYKRLNAKEGFIIYQVKPGDTLNKLATRYHCTVSDILRWNPKITNRNMIYDNEYLYIRA